MAAPPAPPKQWGISAPMSTALPEPIDNEKTAELIEELKRQNNYEPLEATQKRMSTLALLNRVTQEFVREVSRRQRLPPSQIDQFGGKILTYGSYRLGVFGPGKSCTCNCGMRQRLTFNRIRYRYSGGRPKTRNPRGLF